MVISMSKFKKSIHPDDDLHYKKMGLNAIVRNIPENRQSKVVYRLLEYYNPDILVITGHDSYRNINSEEFKNSDILKETEVVQRVISLTRNLREKENIKIRQPLSKCDIAFTNTKYPDIVKKYETKFSNIERHQRRVDMIDNYSDSQIIIGMFCYEDNSFSFDKVPSFSNIPQVTSTFEPSFSQTSLHRFSASSISF